MPRERTLRRERERARARSTSRSQFRTSQQLPWLCLLLIASTVIVYLPVRRYAFINYDDDAYVTANPHVTSGLNWETLRWAVSSTEEGDNWLPVTWVSHALDCQF